MLLAASCLAAQDSGSARGANGSASTTNSRGDRGSFSNPSSSTLSGQTPTTPSAPTGVTDPSYTLNKGDTVFVSIGTRTNASEATATETIGKRGDVRLPWIEEEVILNGRTVRETERYLENLYKERNLLNRPIVSVKVANYFLREVSISGAVRGPGMLPFPPDTVSMDIADVIFKVGGFTPIAKATDVIVVHRDEKGQETSVSLNLDSLRTGKQKPGKDRAEFQIYPGDRIFVPETLF